MVKHQFGQDHATSEENDVGYFVMVDLNHPNNLHDSHKDFPLAAAKFKIDSEMLLQYQLDLGNRTSQIPKLLETIQSNKIILVIFKI